MTEYLEKNEDTCEKKPPMYYHDTCCRTYICDYIKSGNAKIVGFDENKNAVDLELDSCYSIEKLRIDGSDRLFKCDILAFSNNRKVYIEIVRTNREVLEFKKEYCEKMKEYNNLGCVVVLIDVEEYVNDCINKHNGDEDFLREKLITGIQTQNEMKVYILDFNKNNLPTIDVNGVKFAIKKYDENRNHVSVSTVCGKQMYVLKTQNKFYRNRMAGKSIIEADSYDSSIPFIDNINTKQISWRGRGL